MIDEYERVTERLFDDDNAEALNPTDIFQIWMDQAKTSEVNDPDAMTLATVDSSGLPDARMILLKSWDANGFVFYSNMESTKGLQLADNPKAALLFHWKTMRRQVRIRGLAEPVSSAEADAYFASRPRRSQIGAYASAQSRPLQNRAELTDKAQKLTAQFDQVDVARPEYWTGYCVRPLQIEFWKDGDFRLHDRMLFSRDAIDGDWSRCRLSP